MAKAEAAALERAKRATTNRETANPAGTSKTGMEAAAKEAVQEKKRSHTSYQPETFMAITRWMENTRIQYRPHAKKEGSKSFDRYESYSQARTVGESLALGSKPEDWCWDLERDFIKVLGPVREEPLDPTSVQDLSRLTDVDRAVGRWFKREAARMLGVDLKDLAKDKSWGESVIIRIRRSVAEKTAQQLLRELEASGRKMTDSDMLQVLDQWGFKQNSTRENVMPVDASWVHSDTLGLIPSRDGRTIASRGTLDYPNVVKFLTRFLKDHRPADLPFDFPFTSINVNKNYAARLHRDAKNVGTSMIKVFGSFTGGTLDYWPDDDGKLKLEQMPVSRKVTLSLNKGLALFDGKRAHEVNPFEGTRYSVVFFTCARYSRASQELKTLLIQRGINFPTKTSGAWALRALAPPAGLSDLAAPLKAEGKYRFWPMQPCKAAARGAAKSDAKNLARNAPQQSKPKNSMKRVAKNALEEAPVANRWRVGGA